MSDTTKKSRKNILERATYAYIRRIKKWMDCPACRNGKMAINKASTLWQCEDCGYKLSADEFEDDYVFWFCDECESYLNSQDGFDRKATRHVCQICGHANDTTPANIKGTCVDCGKLLPDPDAKRCVDCRLKRREKIKKGVIIGSVATVLLAIAAAVSSTSQDDAEDDNSPKPLLPDGDPEDNDVADDDEVYGLGPGKYPTCKTCGALMTEFDNWAWYTCPDCEDKVRIIEDQWKWYDEIFKSGTREHYSDYDLADFCRGGELSED